MTTPWTERYAQRMQRMRSSEVRELLKISAQPDVISFAGGLPAADLFPIERFEEACRRVLAEHGPQALQYSTTEGELSLRELIARHARRYGLAAGPDNVLITSGSQQALDLIGKAFLNAGDHVLVERPTYLGALQAWNAYEAQYVSVGVDEDGMRTGDLDDALRRGPKFVYALPNFQNPTGVTLSLPRRRALIERADAHGVPILEDDPYGQLRYEGTHVAPIVTLDAEYRGLDRTACTGNVLYLSTFSKTLAPGLRLGWIIGPAAVIRRLTQAKQGTDLHTSTFAQLVAYEVARSGFLDQHVRRLRTAYGARRDAMLAAMAESFPEGVTWTRPEGGLFVWVTLPSAVDAGELLKPALEEHVAFVPGRAFHPDGSGSNTMRLNFTNASVDRAAEGIERLGRILHRALEADPAAATVAERTPA